MAPLKLFLADVREDRFRTLFFSRESRRNESEGEAPTSNASLSVSLCKCQAVCQGNLHTLARPTPFPAYDLCGIMSRHNLKKLSSQLYSGFLLRSQSRERISSLSLSYSFFFFTLFASEHSKNILRSSFAQYGCIVCNKGQIAPPFISIKVQYARFDRLGLLIVISELSILHREEILEKEK